MGKAESVSFRFVYIYFPHVFMISFLYLFDETASFLPEVAAECIVDCDA